MNTTEITIIWNGSQWDCSASGAPTPLPVGSSILLRIPSKIEPENVAARSPVNSVLMQKAGTFLYLPITPGGDDAGAWELWDAHRLELKPKLSRKPMPSRKPKVSRRPEKAHVPILLQEDLYVIPGPKPVFAPCRCTIGIQKFESLNMAGTFALSQWSNREKDTLSAFREIYYLRNGRLTTLMDQRLNLLENAPFRDETGEDEGPELFDTSKL
jgi:hypothetical protein